MSEQTKYKIVNIRRGTGYNSQYLYAQLVNATTGEVVIAATLNYIQEKIAERDYVLV